MGCDIHSFTEKKLKDGKWYCLDPITLNRYQDEQPEYEVHYENQVWKDRHYAFFSWLAGVRGAGPIICPPKGFPSDASLPVRWQYDNFDWHTPSWLTLMEIQMADWPEDLNNYKLNIVEYFNLHKDEKPENYRVIFWFDN